MTLGFTYSEWRLPNGVVTRFAEEANRVTGAERHDFILLAPGTRIRHADYQMLTGEVRSLDSDSTTARPYVLAWDNPTHARLALGIEWESAHPSKIRSLEP
jgi:hypothetical protein